MVVRATRVLVGRCRQLSGRSASQRGCGRLLPQRAYSGGRCLGAAITSAAVPRTTPAPQPSSSLPARPVRFSGSSSSSSSSGRPWAAGGGTRALRSLVPQARQQQHGRRELAIALGASRRALSFSASTPDQQQRQHYGNGSEGSSEHRASSRGELEKGGRVQPSGAARVGGSSGGRSSERLEETASHIVQKESDRVWTVPNMITMGRIAFCPVLAGLIVTSQHELALAGLLAASLTDWLDGYIARKWNQKSVLGGFLDPLADKIMVTTVALALGQEGIIPAALVAVMVGRDALLIAGSLAYRYKTRRPEDAFFDLDSLDYKVTPSTLSKVNTVLQFGTLWLGLTNAVYLVPGDAAFSALCVATGAATLASGVNYLLVSGLKPRGRLGKRLMVQRENLQERYRKREVLVRERMGVGRERMRARQGELNDRLKARRRKVAGALKDRINRRRRSAGAGGGGVRGGSLKKGG